MAQLLITNSGSIYWTNEKSSINLTTQKPQSNNLDGGQRKWHWTNRNVWVELRSDLTNLCAPRALWRLSYTEVGQDHNTGCSPASYAQHKGRRHGWRAFLFFLSKKSRSLYLTRMRWDAKQKPNLWGVFPAPLLWRHHRPALAMCLVCLANFLLSSKPTLPDHGVPLDASSPPPPQNYRCTLLRYQHTLGSCCCCTETIYSCTVKHTQLWAKLLGEQKQSPLTSVRPGLNTMPGTPAALSAWFWLSVLNSSKFLELQIHIITPLPILGTC